MGEIDREEQVAIHLHMPSPSFFPHDLNFKYKEALSPGLPGGRQGQKQTGRTIAQSLVTEGWTWRKQVSFFCLPEARGSLTGCLHTTTPWTLSYIEQNARRGCLCSKAQGYPSGTVFPPHLKHAVPHPQAKQTQQRRGLPRRKVTLPQCVFSTPGAACTRSRGGTPPTGDDPTPRLGSSKLAACVCGHTGG